MSIALTNATVETVTRGRIVGGSIVIKDGKITAVGKKPAIPENAEKIDLKGALVTPGLIEPHSHAGLAEDGWFDDGDYNEMSDPITAQVKAIDGFKPTDLSTLEGAASGVTTMYITPGSANIIGGTGAIVKTWGESFYDQIVIPEAGMKMAMGENPKRVYGGKDRAPKTRMGVAAILRDTLNRAKIYEAKKKKAKSKKSSDPFDVDFKLEGVLRVLNGELPARCHAHRSIDMLTFMRIAGEYKFDYCFEHATEAIDILDELKKNEIPIIVGPTFGVRAKRETHNKTFRTVSEAVDAGLTVAITSDHHVTPMRYLPVFAAMAVRAGLSDEDALKCMTINPAKILGIDDRVGSIEKGKDADLVVWSGDPLDIRNRAEKVMIRGRWVEIGEEGRLPMPTFNR